MRMKMRHLASSTGSKLSLSLVGAFAIFLISTGVYVGETSRLLVVLIIQIGAGAFVWTKLRRGQADCVEVVGMALVIGPVLSLASTLVIQLLGGGLWGWSLPAWLALGFFLAGHPFKLSNTRWYNIGSNVG
jgi:hypothetical protein